MIYTVTLNPALDYSITVEEFREGLVNRSSKEELTPGGKGLMVSRMLHNLGVESTALGLAAGFTGAELIRMVHEAGVRTNFVMLPAGMTRINVKLWGGMEGEINAAGPEYDEKSLQALLGKLDVLTSKDTLVLAGTVPVSVPEDLYAGIMERMKAKSPRIVVDATGKLLRGVIGFRPFLVKPNHHELGELYEVTLTTKEEVLPYAKRLREEGAVNVLVSMAGEGAVLAAADGSVWFGEAPEGDVINSVGAGDSMVAGFLAGYEGENAPEKAFRNGIAAGSATAFSAGLAAREEVELLAERVEVWRVE